MTSEDNTRSGSDDEHNGDPTFLSPFAAGTRQPITLVELRMRKLSGIIRQKPLWWLKVHDHAVAAKWRLEMAQYEFVERDQEWGEGLGTYYYEGTKCWPRDVLTDAQLDYIFDELKYVASQVDPENFMHPTSVPGVYQSTSLIPAALKEALLDGVTLLENVSEEEKDWHPGSNRRVLNLINPSLYCFRLGKSLVLKNEHHRLVAGDPLIAYSLEDYLDDRDDFPDYETDSMFSRTVSTDFQLLPAVFDISDTGMVEWKSYINNLHPIKHATLYPAITSILEKFVPMFEKVLSDAASPAPKRIIEVDPHAWYPPGTDIDEWWDEDRWPVIPECPTFVPPTEEGRIDVSLKGRRIRVIIKLAHIVLTPDSPWYPESPWHVEGMANENIVATGLYYYGSENVSEARLAFRAPVDVDWTGYKPGSYDYQGWLAAFGFSSNHFPNQQFGHIVALGDKCVAFPNIYQHRVQPFGLVDCTRPGSRKILSFFLTDPYNVVQSTMMVPPQQREWYVDEMERIPALGNLPPELFDIIADYALEGTITRTEAEEDRKKLLQERLNNVATYNEDVVHVNWDLCEH